MPRPSSRRELEIVGAIAAALNSSPTVQQALERTLQLVTDLLGLQTGWVWLVDSETEHIYSAAAQNLPPYLQEPVRMTGGWCWCIEQFRNGSLTPSNVDVMECTRLRPAVRARQTDLTRNIAHHASVPLSFQGIDSSHEMRAVDGLLTGLHEPRASHLRMLDAIAGRQHVAAAYRQD